AALRQTGRIGSYTAVLLADGDPPRGADRLPGQEKLKNTIRGIFPKVTVRTPDQDSWIELTRYLKNSEVFIFIGHGVPDGNGTALVFGKSRVKATDFPREFLTRLQLVILEACSTGTGGDRGLQETGTLVHTFLSAGVPIVIASRWDVDSESAATFLSTFLRHMEKGEGASEAVYHARNEALELHRHPYYWAGLDIMGISQPMPTN